MFFLENKYLIAKASLAELRYAGFIYTAATPSIPLTIIN